MLADEVNFDIREFKKIFEKKFNNFCKKAPILISYVATENEVVIYKHDESTQSQKILDKKFDFSIGVKENIKSIKDFLVSNHYPIMYQKVKSYTNYTNEEINEMVRDGIISIDQAPEASKVEVHTIDWRVEKVIVLRDELFVRNLDTNKMYRYKMEVPVTIFLRKMRVNFTPIEAWEYFQSRSIILNEIFDTYNT